MTSRWIWNPERRIAGRKGVTALICSGSQRCDFRFGAMPQQFVQLRDERVDAVVPAIAIVNELPTGIGEALRGQIVLEQPENLFRPLFRRMRDQQVFVGSGMQSFEPAR